MKKEERVIRDEQIRLYVKDHTYKDAAEKWGLCRKRISEICKGSARIGFVNQYVNPGFDYTEIIKRHVANANPDMEYVRGFTNVNTGKVVIRHKLCGREFERSVESLRHGRKTICPFCREEEKRTYKQQHAEDVARRKQERYQQAIINKAKARAIQHEQTIARQKARRHNCPVCGVSTTRPKYCSNKCCSKAHFDSSSHESRRRARIKEQYKDKDITLKKLYTRDNGQCWICGLLCDWSDIEDRGYVKVAGNMYPSIDHVVPLSHGGEHSWANVRLAHRICNSVRYEHAPRGHKKVG